MSGRSEPAPLFAVLAVALFLVGGPAKAGEPVYTDVASCRAQDLGPDEFVRHCKGPRGYAATLYYFDGRAVPGFGKAKPGTRDEFDLTSVELKPIEIGTGVPFGKRIEWVMSDHVPCAAILRVGTSKGERLVVSALDGASTRLGLAKTNKDARRIAEGACKGGTAATTGLGTSVASAPWVPDPTGRPKVGDVLPICSKCPVPVITEVSGEAAPSVVARISRPVAEEHCGAWHVDDAEGQASCVALTLEDFAGRKFTASATCKKLEIASDDKRYRYDGPGKDEFGDNTPQWRNLESGQRAELSAAGNRRTVSMQFDVLCPGMLAAMGFKEGS